MRTRRILAGIVIGASLCAGLAACDGGAASTSKNGVVVGFDHDDPRMLAATAEARRRWPEFVAEFNNKQPDAAYAVKIPFKVGATNNTEHMWIQVVAINGSSIVGTLDNEPTQNVRYKVGDRVMTTVGEIEDWMVGRGEGDLKGLFTLPVLEQIKKERAGGQARP